MVQKAVSNNLINGVTPSYILAEQDNTLAITYSYRMAASGLMKQMTALLKLVHESYQVIWVKWIYIP
jgi:hypothetical protein